MKNRGRIFNSLSNIATGIGMQVLSILLNVVSRKIFVLYLGIEILGVNGVITSLISMLSIVELGVGVAISQSLYAPLGNKDYRQVHAIMNLFARLYRYIALAVFFIGVVLFPFLKYIVNTEVEMQQVIIIYLIYLLNAVLSYFVSYRRNMLTADQRTYIINNITMMCSVGVTLLQIATIIFTGNFILYLLISVTNNLLQNIYIYYKTNKMYPYLTSKEEVVLDPAIKEKIFTNVKALFVAKISMYLVFGVDNVLLSMLAGTVIVGIYSNYTMIINAIKNIISQIFNGITASYGNYLVSGTKEDGVRIFYVMQFLNFWISTFAAIGFLLLLNPTITVWLGDGMIFETSVVVAIVLSFYLDSMRNAIEIARSAAGLYSPYPFFKYWWFMQAIVNIVLSVILSGIMDSKATGIFLATAISHILPTIVLPHDMFIYVFEQKAKKYYLKLIKYYSVGGIIAGFCMIISNIFVSENKWMNFGLNFIIVLVIPNISIFLIYRKSEEFMYLYNRFGKMFHKDK